MVMVGGPILLLFLFGSLYMQNVVNHIDTVVWDQDNTSLSRTVIESFRNSDRFNIIGTVASEQELKQVIDNGTAKVGLVVPRHFMRDIKKQHPTQILVCIDGTNLVISNSVISSALEIVQTLSGGVGLKMLEGGGALPEKAKSVLMPISFRPRIWYNPTFSYSNFLLLGLLGTAVQQMVLLYTSVSIVRDKTNGTLPSMTNGMELAKYVVGKAVPYFVINLININLLIVLVYYIFAVPFAGNLGLLLLLEVLFIGGLVALGLFLSIVARTDLEATQLSIVIAVPSFLISGFTWPMHAMPVGVRILAECLPLTYFVNSLRDLALKGIGIETLAPSLLYLAALTALLFPLGIFLLRRGINKSKGAGQSNTVPVN